MAEKSHLEYFLIRYVPNVVSNDSISIGVVLFDPISPADGFCDVCFITDWQRVRLFDPDADLDTLQALAFDIQEQLRTPVRREYLLRMMEDSFSNAIQLSPRRECVTEDSASQIHLLADRYLNCRQRIVA